MLNREQHAQATALFNAKRENVAKLVNSKAARRGWPADYRSVATQDALLALWLRCRQVATSGQPASAINCQVVVRTGARLSNYQHRRDRERLAGRAAVSLDALRDAAARRNSGARRQGWEPVAKPGAEIVVDGDKVTLADISIEFPEFTAAHVSGEVVDLATVAARLGVSCSRVRQIAGRLGGAKIGGRWVFPESAGLDEAPAGRAHAAEG